jgi:hypothetical protein
VSSCLELTLEWVHYYCPALYMYHCWIVFRYSVDRIDPGWYKLDVVCISVLLNQGMNFHCILFV